MGSERTLKQNVCYIVGYSITLSQEIDTNSKNREPTLCGARLLESDFYGNDTKRRYNYIHFYSYYK